MGETEKFSCKKADMKVCRFSAEVAEEVGSEFSSQSTLKRHLQRYLKRDHIELAQSHFSNLCFRDFRVDDKSSLNTCLKTCVKSLQRQQKGLFLMVNMYTQTTYNQ